VDRVTVAGAVELFFNSDERLVSPKILKNDIAYWRDWKWWQYFM
jgi:hypothetical protein